MTRQREGRDSDADKLRPDANEIAFRTVQAALGQADKPQPPGSGSKKPEAVRRGRKGGKKGGGGRAQKLTQEERSNIASKAATVRWESRD